MTVNKLMGALKVKKTYILASMIVLGTVMMGLMGGHSSANAATIIFTSNLDNEWTGGDRAVVIPTGKNAMYTRPGTVKGAKMVLTKSQMMILKQSKSSKNYLHATSAVMTNNHSVYYRVTTFNDKIHGYVYGGQSMNLFRGGLKSAYSTKIMSFGDPNLLTKPAYRLSNPKKYTLWTTPKNAVYHSQKVQVSANAILTPLFGSYGETLLRENWHYTYVVDINDTSVKGWIYNKGLTPTRNYDPEKVKQAQDK